MKRVFLCGIAIAAAAAQAGAIDYVGEVLPIMKAHCWNCHSNEKEVKGNLALEPETLFDQIGKYNIIRPGEPDTSGFVERLKLEETHTDFMPRKGDPLSRREIETIERWIREGAVVDAKKPTEDEAKRLAEMKPAGPAGADREFHSWKNREGRAIEARFISLENDSVKLVRRDGKTFLVPLASLDEASAAQAKQLVGR